ncbi:MucR family transcriptional regulator [Rhizobium sp. BK602]|uniref:MucR family transcriptional regulator n=1 Tax=Rhizobium sp. BK602 TaxID=2586986 RepID=UPI00161A4057|nr:MucR family transcriptional regulator [Rhizobium sp. BK602]MBB3609904.1 putative transcriptional regulator [Rhizobium sp. BK602]
MPEIHSRLLNVTRNITCSFVANNVIARDKVPDLIQMIYESLAGALDAGTDGVAPKKPAVPIAKSVTPDYIICLEDGQKFKSLRRHLRAKYNLTPEQYRAKWGLPSDYPLIAPNYAAERSRIAKRNSIRLLP